MRSCRVNTRTCSCFASYRELLPRLQRTDDLFCYRLPRRRLHLPFCKLHPRVRGLSRVMLNHRGRSARMALFSTASTMANSRTANINPHDVNTVTRVAIPCASFVRRVRERRLSETSSSRIKRFSRYFREYYPPRSGFTASGGLIRFLLKAASERKRTIRLTR